MVNGPRHYLSEIFACSFGQIQVAACVKYLTPNWGPMMIISELHALPFDDRESSTYTLFSCRRRQGPYRIRALSLSSGLVLLTLDTFCVELILSSGTLVSEILYLRTLLRDDLIASSGITCSQHTWCRLLHVLCICFLCKCPL